ncbi:MAG: efflux RND transporter periplasmic adaptor subunit [Myxococcales bacterium]
MSHDHQRRTHQPTMPSNDNSPRLDRHDNAQTNLKNRRGLVAALGAVGAAGIITVVLILTRSEPASGIRLKAPGPGGVSPAPATNKPGTTAEAAEGGLAPPLSLPKGSSANNPVLTVPVRSVRLAGDIQVVGNVSYDADHFAIVGPLVDGRMTRLAVGVGGHVRRGQIMAEIESADVGDARGALISAKARLAAADANLRRERELAEKRISSVREREVAEAQWASEGAAMRAAQEKLRAIGLSDADIRAIDDKAVGGRVAIRAPIDGTVIERLVTLGEAVERAADAFKIANLTHVWILLDLYEKDLARVRVGQSVEARTEAYPGEVFPGRVAYVAPVIDEATRTAKVRVQIANDAARLHIGQLVNARLIGSAELTTAPVLAVPRSAVQRVDGKPLLFVKGSQGYERRSVELGISGGELVEIRNGVREGEQIATDGAFLLKSELLR